MTSDNLSQLSNIISDCTGADPAKITPDATLEALGADSLDMIELVMEIEETFGIDLTDDQAEAIRTVGDVMQLLEGCE